MDKKEQIAVKQFKKSETGSMERKDFEKKFKEAIKGGGRAHLSLKNGGVLIATIAIIDNDDDVDLYTGMDIGYIPLKSIERVF